MATKTGTASRQMRLEEYERALSNTSYYARKTGESRQTYLERIKDFDPFPETAEDMGLEYCNNAEGEK